MNRTINKYTVLTLLTLGLISSATHAQTGSAFSYQGELLNNGSPANADYDFGVDLYMTEIGGSPVTTDTHDDISVENGLFNLEIDFGDVVYEDTDQYYIELRVTPSAGGATAVLAPRTKLLSVPYATQALFGTSPWEIDGTTVYSLGKVGVGLDDPTDRLHVRSPGGEGAFRVQLDGQTRIRVHSNGGTSIGVNTTPPENGFFVEGDTKQDFESNGMLKYMFRATCDATPTIDREYNGTKQPGVAGISSNGTGNCTISLPFNISNNYISATAIRATSGDNRIVGCVPFLAGMICQLSVGSTGADANGSFDVLVY